jgi:hypothetical protein
MVEQTYRQRSPATGWSQLADGDWPASSLRNVGTGGSMNTTFGNTRVTLVAGNITTQEVDAVVNAANSSLMGGGGVDGAIHNAGGPEIKAACREIARSPWPTLPGPRRRYHRGPAARPAGGPYGRPGVARGHIRRGPDACRRVQVKPCSGPRREGTDSGLPVDLYWSLRVSDPPGCRRGARDSSDGLGSPSGEPGRGAFRPLGAARPASLRGCAEGVARGARQRAGPSRPIAIGARCQMSCASP